MVQTKYNSKIYNAADEKTLEVYSHLRANAISPLNIKRGEKVLVMEPDSIALLEYLQETGAFVTASDMSVELQEAAAHEGLVATGLDITSFDRLTGPYNTIIMMGQQSHTPMAAKKFLAPGGRLALVFSSNQMKEALVQEMLMDAGFLQSQVYFLTPNYKYTMEIYSSEYEKKSQGDYLIIANQ